MLKIDSRPDNHALSVVQGDFKAVKNASPQDVFITHYGDTDRFREKATYLEVTQIKRSARNDTAIAQFDAALTVGEAQTPV